MTSANVAVTRKGQVKDTSSSFYAAGCYAIPLGCLYGTAAEVNFWDVVYFRAHEAGGAFDTSVEELAEQMGLSRQIVGQLRWKAVERGELIEDASQLGGHRFEVQVSGWGQLTRKVIYKPLGYVRNGWHRVVTPAIPKRVLNLYLQQPRQQVYHLDTATIAEKCKRQFPRGEYKPVSPLNLADVGKALRLLARLGLFAPEGNGFRIEWSAFNRPALLDAPGFDAPDPREHPLFCQAAAIDGDRAERALELLDVGQYDLEAHFADIFRDLVYVRAEDYTVLRSKVHRYRNRPPGPNRWRDTWKAFQYELKRRIAEIRTPKVTLSDATPVSSPLALDLSAGCALAVRMVSRVEWPWYFDGEGLVRLSLRSGDQVIFAREVGPGDAEVRYALQPEEWSDVLTLQAQFDRPAPGVRVEAWLEARLRK